MHSWFPQQQACAIKAVSLFWSVLHLTWPKNMQMRSCTLVQKNSLQHGISQYPVLVSLLALKMYNWAAGGA